MALAHFDLLNNNLNDLYIPHRIAEMGHYTTNNEITLLSDVTYYEKLVFLFGSPSDKSNGYETQIIYPWALEKSNNLGIKQPNIGMTVHGEKLVFNWISNTKIKYISGNADLRTIFGFKRG